MAAGSQAWAGTAEAGGLGAEEAARAAEPQKPGAGRHHAAKGQEEEPRDGVGGCGEDRVYSKDLFHLLNLIYLVVFSISAFWSILNLYEC